LLHLRLGGEPVVPVERADGERRPALGDRESSLLTKIMCSVEYGLLSLSSECPVGSWVVPLV
jgi:hypothetical protein